MLKCFDVEHEIIGIKILLFVACIKFFFRRKIHLNPGIVNLHPSDYKQNFVKPTKKILFLWYFSTSSFLPVNFRTSSYNLTASRNYGHALAH